MANMDPSRIWYCGTCKHVWRGHKVLSDDKVFSPRACPNCGSHVYGRYEGVSDITAVTKNNPYLFRLKSQFLERERMNQAISSTMRGKTQ